MFADDSCTQPCFFFFFFPSELSTSAFSSTDLAPERSNKVVSMTTQRQVTDSQQCQSSCCQTHRTSSIFIVLNIEPFPSQAEVRVEIYRSSLARLRRRVRCGSPVAGIPQINPTRQLSLFKHQREKLQAITSFTLWLSFSCVLPNEALNSCAPNNSVM